MNWWERPVWSLDLETTGADPHSCQIVEWSLLKVAPSGHVLETHGGIVSVDVPAEAAAVHGITSDTARHGRSWREARHLLRNGLLDVLMADAPLVVFNAAYDLTVLHRLLDKESLTTGVRVIDPLVIDRHCDRYRRGSRRLEDVCRLYGVKPGSWHSAQADALAAAHLAYRIAEEHHELRGLTLDELHDAQATWADAWAANLEAYLRNNGKPDATIERGWPLREPMQARGSDVAHEGGVAS